jgi:phosphate/sulfate permease
MEIMPGVACSRAISAVNGRLVAETLSLWVVAPLVASSLAFVLVRLL